MAHWVSTVVRPWQRVVRSTRPLCDVLTENAP